MSSDRNWPAALMVATRLVVVAGLLVATGCGSKRAAGPAANTLSPNLPAPAPTSLEAGGPERRALADNRSCDELTSDAEDHVAKMSGLASRRKKALLFVPKTVVSVFKRATGRAESAQELARKYEQRRALVVAINAALAYKGCATVELPSESETKASGSSGSASGRGRY